MSDKKWAHLPGPDLLSKWRSREKLTQQQAADLIGIDLSTYNAFENGRERPGLDYAVRIDEATKGKVEPHHWAESKVVETRARAV